MLLSALALMNIPATSFVDDFNKPMLDARWHWRAPVGGECSLTANRGWLRIHLPPRKGGYNHWHGVFDAPMLLTDAPDGDWVVETRIKVVHYDEGNNFHTGIVIAHSERYVTIWGLFYAPETWKMKHPQVWLERTGEAKLATCDLPSNDIYLRIEKRDGMLRALLKSGADAEWRTGGELPLWFEPTKVGLVAKAWGENKSLTVDFDYFKLQQLSAVKADEPMRIPVAINAHRRLNKIDPMIYGHFIEHLGRCIYGGIWAEMLSNRKFTGAADENGVIEGWEPIGRGVRFAPDHEVFYVGGQAQRIEGTGVSEHGIAQRGLEIEPKQYVGRIVLQGEGVDAITVSLRAGNKVLASQTLNGISSRWRKLRFKLTARASASDAVFAITFRGKGILRIGAVSLMPADNIHGMRRDVIDAIKAIRPPIIRWPGGNFVSGYHWRDGIGDPDRRPPRWDRAWNAWEWNDFGTDEFIQFCRLVGCEPYICVNAGEGYADEAGEWVEYCNGSVRTRWGKVRARNGHREPYRVRFWGIGNEMYGRWQLGHLDAVKYALKSIEFARAMKRVDKRIRLIEVGVDGAGWGGWNEKVVKIAGAHFDMLAVHYYQGYNRNDDPSLIYTIVATAPVRVERMLMETFDIIERNKPHRKRITIAFDEWNVWMPHQTTDVGLEGYYALRDAIFAAGVFHALHRLGDKVEMANLAQLVNVLGAIRTTQTKVLLTPIYHAFAMYVHNTGEWRVDVDCQSPKLSAPVAMDAPVVDVSATLSEDGNALYIGIINRHPERPARLQLSIDGFQPRREVHVEQLTSSSFNDANTFDQPDKVMVRKWSINVEDASTLTLPKHSITMLRFERK